VSDDDEKEVRGALTAQTMRWRLAIGVAAWGIAVASTAFVGLVLADASFVHVDGKGRLVAYATPAILTFLVAGFVLLRVGEIDLATGRLVRAAPVPWPRILVLVSAMTIVAAAIIAWPLGVYTSVRASGSACGQYVPIERLRRLTDAPLSYASVSFADEGCEIGIAAPGHDTLAVVVRERPAPDDHEWQSLCSRFHPEIREHLEDDVVLLQNPDVLVLARRDGRTARFVQLRTDVFGYDDAIQLARELPRP
jgi:hypothetical protein